MKKYFTKKNILKAIKYVFMALVFYFLGKYLISNFQSLKDYKFHLDIPLFILSVVVFFGYKFYNAILWHYITLKNDCAIDIKKAVISWGYSQLGKYIPGKIFYLGARLYYYNEEGKSNRKVTFSFFIENICTLLAATFILLVAMLFVDIPLLNQYKMISVALLVAFFIMINPRILEFCINVIMKLIKKPVVNIPMSYKDMFVIVLLFISNWLVLGLGFFLLVNSMYPIGIEYFFFLSGSFAFSSMAGILAIIAPGGIGVREYFLIVTLNVLTPVALPAFLPAILAVVSRVWVTLAELLAVLLSYVFAKIYKIEFKVDDKSKNKSKGEKINLTK